MKNNTKNMVHISLIATFGILLFVIESYFPRVFPWTKPGLANVATLLALYTFDWKTTLFIVLTRIFVGSLVIGSLFTPTFLLSISGGIASAIVMLFISKGKILSIIGTSILGSVTHLLVQLFVAFFFFVKNIHLFNLIPLVILTSMGTGFMIGLASKFLLDQFPKLGLSPRWYSPQLIR